MGLFDFLKNEFFRQEQEKNRRLYECQKLYEYVEAEVGMAFEDEMEDERQCGGCQSDCDCGRQAEYGYVDDGDCEDIC